MNLPQNIINDLEEALKMPSSEFLRKAIRNEYVEQSKPLEISPDKVREVLARIQTISEEVPDGKMNSQRFVCACNDLIYVMSTVIAEYLRAKNSDIAGQYVAIKHISGNSGLQ